MTKILLLKKIIKFNLKKQQICLLQNIYLKYSSKRDLKIKKKTPRKQNKGNAWKDTGGTRLIANSVAEKVKGTKQDKDKHCELVRCAVFSEQNKKLNAQTKLVGQEGDMLFQLKKNERT